MSDLPGIHDGLGPNEVSVTSAPAGVKNALVPKAPSERKEVRNSAVIEALGMDGATVAGVARDFDISETRVRQIRAAHSQVVQTMRTIDNRQIVEKIDDIIARTLDSFSDEDIKNLKAKDRSIMLAVLLDKRQLLRGEATVIHGTERRKKLEEMLPALAAELQRRGMTVDLAPTEFSEVLPVAALPAGEGAG